MNSHEQVWETYVASWKTSSSQEKTALLERSLADDAVYSDPLMHARGRASLMSYMENFHAQSPGFHFVTLEFSVQHNQSLTKWEMRDADNNKVGDGVCYGRYDDEGKLKVVSNFFEVPDSSP